MITNISQRWESDRQKFVVPDSVFIPRLHEVSRIDLKSAREFVIRYHYSRTMPAVRRSFGLFRNSALVGVAVFSHPVNDRTLTNAFGGEAIESLELGRFCLLDSVEFNAESWFMAICRAELRKEDFRGIVAFSDPMPRTNISGDIIHAGHIGTIYAASSAIYLGYGEKDSIRLLPNGEVFSKRAISKIRNLETGHKYAAKLLTDFGATEMPTEEIARRVWLKFWLDKLTRRTNHPGNHKYLMPLQKGLSLPKGKPYPKVKFIDKQLTLF